MNLEEMIASIETLDSRERLRAALQRVIENFGFEAFCFLDISDAYRNDFLYFGTTGERWEQEYLSNSFFEVDEVIKVGRRANRPFSWSDVPLPERLGKKRSAAQRVFDASRDYRFRAGYVIPLHFVDPFGRYHSVLCSLVWSGSESEFARVRDSDALTLHVILTYWIQRVVDLREANDRPVPIDVMARRRHALELKLTDRERDVLSWAARGKTAQDTATILGLSDETVTSYVKGAIFKLGAGNKTHAVAKALHLGLIDL